MPGEGPRKVTVLTYELRGLAPVGGVGTATTHLALGLARDGHSVEILLGWQNANSIDPYWRDIYERAGIRVGSAPDSGEHVDSWHFRVMRNVELALLADEPDIVVAHDLNAPAYSALRLRQAGIAFENCLFVVYCHGNRRYVADTSQQLFVRDLPTVLRVGVLERASAELADAVVSPSAYLVDWMRDEGWHLPEQTHVIPNLTRSGAVGESPQQAAVPGRRVERIAFFGRLDEKKGLQPFSEGLNALEPDLLGGIGLEFVGKPTATWPVARVEALLSDRTKRALRDVSFYTDLDQPEALSRLKRPGTLAVMPSLLDNSPSTVYECLEHGVPFIASNVGGVSELISAADRTSVLFEPTSGGVEDALRRALEAPPGPAAPAFDAETSLRRWREVFGLWPNTPGPTVPSPDVDVIVTSRELERPVEAARAAALAETSAPFVLFLDDKDVPDDELVRILLRAQVASGADVVTCGLQLPAGVHFFTGEPGGLGVLGNDYGTVALVRRSLLTDVTAARPAEHDPDWPLMARLATSGARIISIPRPLVATAARPGSLEEHPANALLVVQELERALPDAAASLARLAAGLAAEAARSAHTRARRQAPAPSRWHRRARSFARRALSAKPASPT